MFVNGCFNISSAALCHLVESCKGTLLDFECACNDQPDFKNDIMLKLGTCWNLVTLDVTGCTKIDDMGYMNLAKGEAQLRAGLSAVQPGLVRMLTFKAGNTKVTDHGLSCIAKCCPNIEHLELNRADLTDVGTKCIATGLPKLKFLDLTAVSGITLAMLDEIK